MLKTLYFRTSITSNGRFNVIYQKAFSICSIFRFLLSFRAPCEIISCSIFSFIAISPIKLLPMIIEIILKLGLYSGSLLEAIYRLATFFILATFNLFTDSSGSPYSQVVLVLTSVKIKFLPFLAIISISPNLVL